MAKVVKLQDRQNNQIIPVTRSVAVEMNDGTSLENKISSIFQLPTVSSSDNGKILRVVNGQWTLITPNVVYSGTGEPDNSLGNDGDIYLQTS